MDDNRIIGLYWERDEDAIRETREKYGNAIFHFAKRLLRINEDAEECENDTYFQAWKTMPPVWPQHLKSYLLSICRNLSCTRLDYLTAKKRHSVLVELTDELSACIPDSSAADDESGLEDILSDFLRSLPYTRRILFVRRYWYGDSIRAISNRYHFSEGKVKMSLLRTREKLKKRLEQEGF